ESIRAEDTAAFLAGGGGSTVGPAAAAAAAAAAAGAAAAAAAAAIAEEGSTGDGEDSWAMTPTGRHSERYDSLYGGVGTDTLSSPANSPRASIASSFFSVSSPPYNPKR
ncbi:unnamed protein product, partial [Laminaria digitata]